MGLDLIVETDNFECQYFGSNLNGMKWDEYGENDSPYGLYSFTIQRCFSKTDIDTGVKADSDCDENSVFIKDNKETKE